MRVLTCFIVLVLVSACAIHQTEQGASGSSTVRANDFAYENCLSVIHKVRNSKSLPIELSLIRDVSSHIFLCERTHREPVKFYGKLLRVRGRTIFASSGYALSSRVVLPGKSFAEKISRLYIDPKDRFKIRVEELSLDIHRYGSHPAYMVLAKTRFTPEQVIGIIAVVNFELQGNELTLFTWAYGLGMKMEEVKRELREVLPGFISPQAQDEKLAFE